MSPSILINRDGYSGSKAKAQKLLQIKSMKKHPILYNDKDQGWNKINGWPVSIFKYPFV